MSQIADEDGLAGGQRFLIPSPRVKTAVLHLGHHPYFSDSKVQFILLPKVDCLVAFLNFVGAASGEPDD